MSEAKEVTTLGRGGSDTTAVALAAELGAECCEILTDVDGIFTADPRIVPSAKRIEECSYDEALELSNRGAKLHSRSVEVAKRFNVPVRVAPSADPSAPGTVISSASKNLERSKVCGVATRDGMTFFRAHGSLSQIRHLLDSEKVSPRYFQMGEGECSWLSDVAHSPRLRDRLMRDGISFEESGRTSLVSVVGESLSEARDVMSDFLDAVESSGTRVIAMASNSLSICVAVESVNKPHLAQRLHERFIEAPH